eukprot:TRINITY_DN44197_c0_g1_i1.p1 TRINITY_DN44197_c0_g1~~TRINITY_DN44197_c0_g1_i1.p1  ORF type:complete len:507 (+),score=95.14 TRINITY_DN44197_c0_g1_i1:32-1522(+)
MASTEASKRGDVGRRAKRRKRDSDVVKATVGEKTVLKGLAAEWVPSEAPPKCLKGHAMIRQVDNPVGYRKTACCDICGLPHLAEVRSHFFHCGECKFDTCPECCAVSVRYHTQCSDCVVEVLQDTSAVPAALARSATSGNLSQWAWRTWVCAATVTRFLEGRFLEAKLPPQDPNASARRPLAIELGAGSGIVSFVLACIGSHDVIITDRREALAVAREAVCRNGLRGDNVVPLPATPHCPAHHEALAEEVAKKGKSAEEGHVAGHVGTECAVCGMVGFGGGALTCGDCGFKICASCTTLTRTGNMGSLPCWYRVQCEYPPSAQERRMAAIGSGQGVAQGGSVNSAKASEAAAATTEETSSGAMAIVRPLDWFRPEDVAAIRAEVEAAGGSPPSLIVAADVAYEKHLVKPLVDTVVLLRDWVRSASSGSRGGGGGSGDGGDAASATLVLGAERRGMGLPTMLLKGLRAHGIALQRVAASAEVEAEGRGAVSIWQAEL